MALYRKKETPEKFLDVSAAMQGKLEFSDPVNLHINGKFDGELVTKGSLIIGKDALVAANIVGEKITVAGKTTGNIRASKSVNLISTAEVSGDIEAPFLSIERGAKFNGVCRMAPHKLTVEELSDYLSIEEDKIMKWVANGQIPVEKNGDQLLFDHKEVENWLAGQG
jgi:excisionase family DNA binding protein